MAQELISIGILFFCALIGGLLASRFKQPAVFGLLLVGAVIGPNSLNLVQDAEMINMMAEFGAILILFLVGLEFDVTKLIRLGARSIVIGLLKFAIVLFFGYQVTLLLGFSMKVALFVGVILSFSSTVVVVKVLEQKSMIGRKEVPLLIAMLIIEDILAVLALTFFSGIRNSKESIIGTFEHIVLAIVALVLAYYIVMKSLKYFVNFIGKDSNEESVLIFLSLGLGALFSYFASYLGLAPSAGAFLAGSIIASLPNSKDYGKAVHPYVMIFTSIFFISMGTLIDFSVIKENIVLILALLITVIITRILSVGVLTSLLANFRDEAPVFSSIAMMAVGEFSLLVAKEGQALGLGVDLVTITAALIFMSAILMTFGINYSEKINHGIHATMSVKTKLKMERISGYMRRFFDQMEIEGYFTNKMKNEYKHAAIFLLLAAFVLFISRRGAIMLNGLGSLIEIGFYVISSTIMVILLKLAYDRLKEAHHTTAVILTNVDPSRNLAKCTMILNSMLLSLLLVLAATIFPFAIFLMNGSGMINMVPFAMLTVAFYFIRKTILLVDGGSSYAPKFKPGLAFAKF